MEETVNRDIYKNLKERSIVKKITVFMSARGKHIEHWATFSRLPMVTKSNTIKEVWESGSGIVICKRF